jgi:hypothetical protein
MKASLSRRAAIFGFAAGLVAFAPAGAALAQYASVEIVVKDKKFEPAEPRAPANARLVIHIVNKDAAPMEFESNVLKVEKVVPANGEGIVRVGPLKAGRYEFFDDFNKENKGILVVE